jgi:hypothetical protein
MATPKLQETNSGPANVSPALQTERLMEHMRAICKGIGPRPATSEAEQKAADYVRIMLASFGYEGVKMHKFRSNKSSGWQTIPLTVTVALAAPLARRLGRRGGLIGGALALWATASFRGVLMAKPPAFQPIIALGHSQNVSAHLPAQAEAKRHVYLIAHLDTNKQRLLFPTPVMGALKPMLNLTLLAGLFSGLSLFWQGLRGQKRLPWWQWLLTLVGLGMAGAQLYDESQPAVEGANDNASALAVVLALAEALKANPLPNTEITFLFTGCEEAGCIGLRAYLDAEQPKRYQSYFIDFEMVGTGNICYITQHGISHFSQYKPAENLLALAAQTARKHPALNVSGRNMLTLEEVATLADKGYQALCIAGHNQEGYLPNWHRSSDALAKIEPGTLSKAARYAYALLQELDASK